MLGLFVVALAVIGIVRMARTRGASPWRYGLLAGIGWLVVGVFTTTLLQVLGYASSTGALTAGATVIAIVAPMAYLGLVALYVRYRIGRDAEAPTGSWSCPHCRTLNQDYALKCDSCGEPFASQHVV